MDLRTVKKLVRRVWMERARYPIVSLPLPTRYEGGWFLAYGDEMGYTIFFGRPFELYERRFFERLVKSGAVNVFADIGANQGLYSLIAARHLRRGHVIAFEPLASEARKLLRNASLNRYTNVTVNEVALGAFEGEADMFMCVGGMAGFSSLRPPADDVTARSTMVRVPVSTLDQHVASNDLSSLEFVKIDVEGGELDVLKGADRAIGRYRPIFMIEVEDRRTRQWGYPASDILRFLLDREYGWFDIDRNGLLTQHRIADEYRWRNLIAVPIEADTDFLLKHTIN